MINIDPSLISAKDEAMQELKETIDVIIDDDLVTNCFI